jgi:hypothetical protein
MELNREYKLGVIIKTVAEIVADALILPIPASADTTPPAGEDHELAS